MRTINFPAIGLPALVVACTLILSVTGCAAKPSDVLTNPPVFGRSANDLHVAWAQVTENGKVVAVVDGRLDPVEYDEISAIIFSPDGRRVAYPARSGSTWRLVVDGRAGGPECDEINPAGVVFSPDGGRLACGARQGRKWFMVMDGEADLKSEYDNLASFTFSPDGRRFAHTAERDSKQTVVVDGRPGRFHDSVSEPVFSPDGKRLGYTALENRRQFVVLDGREGPRYEWTGRPVFSADSRQVAYAAANGRKRLVVRNGVPEGPEYEMDSNIDPVAFAPRDHRLAYTVNKQGRWVMVVDGREGPGYIDIAAGSIVWNPTGRGFAYVAADQGWVVAEDGRQSPAYDEISGAGIAYSPDGRHLVYAARKNRQWFLVLDGAAGPALGYKEIREGPRFSPDGRYLMYTGRNKKKWVVVVNGTAGPAYDSIYRPLLTNEGVEYLAERTDDDWLLRCRLSFTATGAGAGETVEMKVSRLPKEDPALVCLPCRQQKGLLEEDE